MAEVKSLGLHEPSALRYLINEGLLPREPRRDIYQWEHYPDRTREGCELVSEEILIAKSTVVWSQAGTIRRVLKFDIEDESVIQAFTTRFHAPTNALGDETAIGTKDDLGAPDGRALVVVLRSQAHILLLSGDSHVVPLSFEVERAFPCPGGFLLQRISGRDDISSDELSSSFQHDLSTINESLDTIRTSARPSLLVQTTDPKAPAARQQSIPPRTFSCLGVMAELGVVVQSAADKNQSLEECKVLSLAEDIVYVSRTDELAALNMEHEPLTLAVSCKEDGRITIWNVASKMSLAVRRERQSQRPSRKSKVSRRKSSNLYSRHEGPAASVPKDVSTSRNSFGGLAQSYAENVQSALTDRKAFAPEDIASQLGPEFGEIGVQTRASRRVSSMLARTDLAAGADRGIFHELATSHGNRKSMRAGLRGESIGSFTDRQSFGRRRSSFPATSILSTGTSFLNVPGQSHIDALDQGVEDLGLDHNSSDLRRDLGFFKITSLNLLQKSANNQFRSQLKIATSLGLARAGPKHKQIRDILVCIMNADTDEVTIVSLQVAIVAPVSLSPGVKLQYRLKATHVRRGTDIHDATVIQNHLCQRLLVSNRMRQGQSILHLEAPWSPPFRINLPTSYRRFNPYSLGTPKPKENIDYGLNRTMSATEIDIRRLDGLGDNGSVIATAGDQLAHELLIELAPKSILIQDLMAVCNLVLGTAYYDTMLVLFWEVSRWLHARSTDRLSEWTAMVVTIFAMVVPFVEESQAKKGTPSKRRKGGMTRTSGSAVLYTDSLDSMTDEHNHSIFPTAWGWLSIKPSSSTRPTSPKTPRSTQSQQPFVESHQNKSSAVLDCIACAREFVQSPVGEAALGPEGYLSVSVNKERSVRSTSVAKILVGLHLLNEEAKLGNECNVNKSPAVPAVIAQLGLWLGWHDWTLTGGASSALEVSDPHQWYFEDTRISGLDIPEQPFAPPFILEHFSKCILRDADQDFPTLHLLADVSVDTKTGTIYDETVQRLTPRTMFLRHVLDSLATQGPQKISSKVAEAGMQPETLSELPECIVAALRQGSTLSKQIHYCSTLHNSILDEKPTTGARVRHVPSHVAVRDYHVICSTAVDGEPLQRWDAASEADRHAITRLAFNTDRRFQDASKLVNQTRPPVVECTPLPEWNEAELLEAQKELAQFVTRRTLSVASGRGMMHFSARVPLLTERVPIPAFSLQCVMRPHNMTESTQAMTFSADKAAFTEDRVCWAFFHNGTSAGLMISKDAKGIDTSWILYNKPPELTNRHAGFLLALGLNGHLKSLAKWVAFKYLTPKHTMTSIGLLLGLSISYVGSQDQQITRLLSVHVTRLLPPGAAELNLSPLTQTTGIMGIGFLYCQSQHRRMTEIMLSEIENPDSEEGVAPESLLRDEGYRLAAGFALGLINLGRGRKLHSLHEMSLTERLLAVAVGTKNVNLVHVLDRATAGAVIGVAFVYLKTNDVSVARKVDIPGTVHQFDYVRPDIFLLRTLARHLIMWEAISASDKFIAKSLPAAYRHRASLTKTKHLSTEDLPFFNIIAGICFAVGLKHAGTQSVAARDLLITYLDQFLRLIRLPAPNYDAQVTLNSVRNCVDIIALSAAIVMAGSGCVMVMRRLRSLHGRTDRDTPFGSHMAAHMALGALFLGGGTMTFGTSDMAVASLVISLYPVWPADVLDNKGHLQAFRHLWVLAVEGRCLIARDEYGAVMGGVEGFLTMRNGDEAVSRSPGLLPAFEQISKIIVRGPGWWDAEIDFTRKEVMDRARVEGAVNIQMKKMALYDKPEHKDPLVDRLAERELERSTSTGSIPSADPVVSTNQPNPRSEESNLFGWVFNLRSFEQYGFPGKDLILNPGETASRNMLESTTIDSRLMFERNMLPETRYQKLSRSKLWQLKTLVDWVEKMEHEDNDMDQKQMQAPKWKDGRWIRKEVVENLNERVWKMAERFAG